MGNQSVISIEAVIDYIESHLDGKLELETVAEAVHYSKYHLHRLFTETVGMTIHDYVQRRQLTEAAKLLVFSDKPIIEIAFICGYESQQSFSLAFKAMYKSPPAEYREERSFYPLQLRFILHRRTTAMEFTIQDIRLAEKKDIVDWMNLMRLVIDGYPVMDEDDYLAKLEESIDEKRALVLREGDILIGAMAFTYSPGSNFLAYIRNIEIADFKSYSWMPYWKHIFQGRKSAQQPFENRTRPIQGIEICYCNLVLPKKNC